MWRSLVTLPLPPQELFGKVVPHHCPLHLVPAPPEGREHPAPTIHATRTQFINVVNESITSDSEQDSRGQGPGEGEPGCLEGPRGPPPEFGKLLFPGESGLQLPSWSPSLPLSLPSLPSPSLAVRWEGPAFPQPAQPVPWKPGPKALSVGTVLLRGGHPAFDWHCWNAPG